MKIWESSHHPEWCIIWMHGLGANAENMLLLSKQLGASAGIRHVCLDAPVRAITVQNGMMMPAWYDVRGFQLVDREDQEGIEASRACIMDVVSEQTAHFSSQKIILAGFSQGGAMALYTALHAKIPLGGVISLSAYLPLALSCTAELQRSTPIFIGYGIQDEIVLPAWTQKSIEWLKRNEYTAVKECTYAMQHSVCLEELKEMSHWLDHSVMSRQMIEESP